MSHYILQSERSNIQTIPMCNPCTTMCITQQTTIFITSMVALTTSMEVSKSLYIKCHWPRWNFWGRIPFRNRWHGERHQKQRPPRVVPGNKMGTHQLGLLPMFLTPTKTGRGLPNSWQVYIVVQPTSMFCFFQGSWSRGRPGVCILYKNGLSTSSTVKNALDDALQQRFW